MKKRFVAVALILGVIGTSCIGPFNLSNKLLSWNQTVADNKFVNAIVFFVLTPVYGITLFADAVLFNSIEFWTGDNPIEAGIVKKVQGENGIYTVESTENGYNIKNEDGKEMNLVYDKKSNTWSYEADGKSSKLIKIENDNQNAIVYMPNGEEKNVELSQQGYLAFRQSVEDAMYYAAK